MLGCFIPSALAGECSGFRQEGSPLCPHHHLSCNPDCLGILIPGIRSPLIWSLGIWHFTAVPWEEEGPSWSLWLFLQPQGHGAGRPGSQTRCEPLVPCLRSLLCWAPVLQLSNGEAVSLCGQGLIFGSCLSFDEKSPHWLDYRKQAS